MSAVFEDSVHPRSTRAALPAATKHRRVRLKPEPGSVAFWDNRAALRMAPRDFEHLGLDRVLHRITIEGDVPVLVQHKADGVTPRPLFQTDAAARSARR